MFKTTIKALMAHKLRLVLTTLAVMLGVAFIAGTYVFTDTINNVFSKMIDEGSERVDVYVRPKTEFQATFDYGGSSPGFSEDILEAVKAVPGVAVAEGGVQGYAQFLDRDGKAITPIGPPTLGFSWAEDEDLAVLKIVSGSPPRGIDEVAMDVLTAEKYGFAVGDNVKILLRGPAQMFRLAGIIDFKGASSFGGATVAAFDLETSQEVLGKRGLYDYIEVAAADGLSQSALRESVAGVLPDSVEAVTGSDWGSEQKTQMAEGFAFFKTALLVFAGIALFVGSFIIFNTFSITVAQRIREFGLLRAVGATERQIALSVLGEAAIVGIVASILGIAAGMGTAIGLRSLMDAVGFDLPSAPLELAPRTIFISLLVGTSVTLIAALQPARRVARVSPIAAIGGSYSDQRKVGPRRVIIGSVVTALGVALLSAGLFASLSDPLTFVGLGVALTFIGVAVLSPLLVRPVTGLLSWPLPKTLGVAGELARRNSMRSRRRTAGTAAALMIGLALVTVVSAFGASIKSSMEDTLDQTMRADFVVMPKGAMSMQTFSPQVASRLGELPEIAIATAFRYGQWKAPDGTSRFLVAADPDGVQAVMHLNVSSGNIEDLRDGGLLIKRSEAESFGVSVGDTLEMTFPQTGKTDVPVDAIFDANIDDKYILSLTTFNENYPRHDDIAVYLIAAPGESTADALSSINATLTNFPNVEVFDQKGLREQASTMIDQMLSLIYALLGLALFISILGITNTLVLSIYERKRELGLLRAVGATRPQIRRMVRWEAVVVALFGSLLGLSLGLVFSWALVSALADEGMSSFTIPAAQIGIFVVLAGFAAVFAAILPARRAARVDILEAIAFD